LTARRPRTWQECVLWVNLHGYACRLLPFTEWRGILESRTVDPAHPLHPLRSFFLRGAAKGASPAELYQVTRRSIVSPGSLDLGSSEPSARADVDAGTLSLYLDHYASRGLLPAVNAGSRAAQAPGRPGDPFLRPETIEASLNRHDTGSRFRVRGVGRLSSDASLGLLSDLRAWRRGSRSGVFHYRLDVEREGAPDTLPIVIKVRPHEDDAVEASIALAAMCGEPLEAQVRAFQDSIGLRRASDRETAVYLGAEAGLRHVTPACHGVWTDDTGARGLLLERLEAPALMNALDPADWTGDDLRAALSGLAEIHATTLAPAAVAALSPRLRSAATVREMAPLWHALADHAAADFDARYSNQCSESCLTEGAISSDLKDGYVEFPLDFGRFVE
jgi:hypothetical protein